MGIITYSKRFHRNLDFLFWRCLMKTLKNLPVLLMLGLAVLVLGCPTPVDDHDEVRTVELAAGPPVAVEAEDLTAQVTFTGGGG
jgi:hypothetical protein